jgi:hypothetical protein
MTTPLPGGCPHPARRGRGAARRGRR